MLGEPLGRGPDGTRGRALRALSTFACLVLAAAAQAAGDAENDPVAPRRPTNASQSAALLFELSEIEQLIQRAQFRTALSMIGSTRDLLNPGSPRHAVLGARLEVAAATAEVALGQRDRAVASLRRALQADATLTFDPQETSPKLVEVLAEARRVAPPAESLR